ncbi:MAG TPA: hypothetical protein PKA53_08050 [Sphingobacterium sp.]|nr:hypothetical protein [Sphingobacterium sp.]
MIGTRGYTFAGLYLLLLSSCFGDGCNVIPNVTFHTNLNRASHVDVYSPKGWVYATGGVCGLIVYNTGDGLIAYDRCSTVSPEKKNRVSVEGMQMVDNQSGAKWLLMDGSPTNLAECALRRYSVRRSGDNYYVSN